MISYNESMTLIKNIPFSMNEERHPLSDCYGHRLAQDLIAPIPSPPFTNSAMDGFAFKHEDGSKPLKKSKTIFAKAGDGLEFPYAPGSCVGIMTGAPLPEWADTVVPVECTTDTGSHIIINELPEKSANIRFRGEDIDEGAVVLRAGTLLDPERTMVAAAFGFPELPVYSRPKIKIYCTGDELKSPGEPLEPGTIYNSSRYFLESQCSLLGLPYDSMLLKDDQVVAKTTIGDGLGDEPTLILTTGAVSAGEKDFIPDLASQMGFEALMHKVAIRPGKPVFLAKKGQHLWLGLPGNAVSTCVGWHFFARPLLESWAGIPGPLKRKVVVQNSFKKPDHLRCFFRAEVNQDKVWIAPKQGSAHLAASTQSGCYVELPEGTSSIKIDTQVLATFI